MSSAKVDSQSPRPADQGAPGPAQRLASWTTRLLLCGLIAAVGLGFGRQVLQWWAPEGDSASVEPPAQGSPSPDETDDRQMISVGAGPWRLRRELVAGPREQVAAVLVRRAVEITSAASLPQSAPQAAEKALLARAATIPLDAGPQGANWRVAPVDLGVPAAVGLKWPDNRPPAEGVNLAQTDARVVTWGLAVPADESAWAVYCVFSEQTNTAPADRAPELPLPPEARRTLALGTVGGGAMVGFEGRIDPAACQRFFEQWFSQNGWTCVGTWRTADGGWFARFEKSSSRDSAVVDVRVGLDAQRQLQGLLVLSRH